MKNLGVRIFAILLTICIPCLPAFSQEEQKKLKSASLDGATGLFKTWDAETLRRGEANFSVGYDHYNRDPGELSIKKAPLALSYGLIDRIELFGSFDAQRATKTTGAKTYRLLPGQLPVPAVNLGGQTSFSNDAPFIDVPHSDGPGDLHLGAKLGLFSERAGDPLAVSLVGFLKAPTSSSIVSLNRAQSTGELDGGFGFLFSKRARRFAQLHLNTLVNYVQDPEMGVKLGNLQNEFIYRGGAAFPTYGMFQIITEITGKAFFGSRTAGANPRNPIDFIVGLRAYPKNWISVGLGYQASLNHVDDNPTRNIFGAGTNGMVAQLAFGVRRNEPPSVACAVNKTSIVQGETAIIRANAKDPDGDSLTYSWAVSGGKITGGRDTATFDAAGAAPGKYVVTATVSDGKHEASCTAEIIVTKRNLPPTVTTEPRSATIKAGDSVTIRAIASDPNNDPLTYSWAVDGEKLSADGSSITFGSEGRQPGVYNLAVTVSDGELTASSTSTVAIQAVEKANQQPRIDCLTTSVDVASGGTVELKARATDPDNDPITVTWSANTGSVTGTGESATYNAGGVKAGTYTVTATANDGKGGRASCTMTVNVSERVSLVREGKVACGGFAPGSARTDNCAKAALDDLAVRMKSDPRLKANVIGYTDGSRLEKSVKGLGEKRAKGVVAYLTQKGVDAAQLQATDGGANNPIGDNKTSEGRKKNRRVEIEVSVR